MRTRLIEPESAAQGRATGSSERFKRGSLGVIPETLARPASIIPAWQAITAASVMTGPPSQRLRRPSAALQQTADRAAMVSCLPTRTFKDGPLRGIFLQTYHA